MAEKQVGDLAWADVFSGNGIDVGCADDKIPVKNSIAWDKPDGSGDDLTKDFPDQKFSFVHASQVLEHAINPVVMLRSWIACLKPGGYIVATVPDWSLYEKHCWPSTFNAGHKSSWSMTIGDKPTETFQTYQESGAKLRIHCKLPEWLNQFCFNDSGAAGLNTFKPCEVLLCRLVLCRLVTTNYDYSLGSEIDQTLDPEKGVECFIEFVLRRVYRPEDYGGKMDAYKSTILGVID